MQVRTPLTALIALSLFALFGVVDAAFYGYQMATGTPERSTPPGAFVEKGLVLEAGPGQSTTYEIRKSTSRGIFEVLLNKKLVGSIQEDYIETATGYVNVRPEELLYAYSRGEYEEGHKVYELLVFSATPQGRYTESFHDEILNIVELQGKTIVTKLLSGEHSSRKLGSSRLVNFELVRNGSTYSYRNAETSPP